MKFVLTTFLFLSATVAVAEDKARLVSVLPFDTTRAKLDEANRTALEESIRTEAGDVLGQFGLTVLTSDTQLKILTDNGIDPNKACEAACHLEAARELNARYFISGIVTAEGDGMLAFIRLFDSASGRQLASAQVEGNTVREIRKGFAAQAQAFFAKAGFGNTPPASPPPTQNAMAPPSTADGAQTARWNEAHRDLSRHEAGDLSMSPPTPIAPPATTTQEPPAPPPSPGEVTLGPQKQLTPPPGVYVPVQQQTKRSWDRWFVTGPGLGFLSIGKEWGYGNWAFRFGWIVLSGRWYEAPFSNGWYVEFGLPFGIGYQWRIATGTVSLGIPNLLELQF